MDKCIKVLIPTGEVRLKFGELTYHPATEKDMQVMDKYTSGDNSVIINASDDYDGWVDFTYEKLDHNGNVEFYDMDFPVIAQYGDEFPV